MWFGWKRKCSRDVEVPTGKTKKRCTAYQRLNSDSTSLQTACCRYNINGSMNVPATWRIPKPGFEVTDWEEPRSLRRGRAYQPGHGLDIHVGYKIITADGG